MSAYLDHMMAKEAQEEKALAYLMAKEAFIRGAVQGIRNTTRRVGERIGGAWNAPSRGEARRRASRMAPAADTPDTLPTAYETALKRNAERQGPAPTSTTTPQAQRAQELRPQNPDAPAPTQQTPAPDAPAPDAPQGFFRRGMAWSRRNPLMAGFGAGTVGAAGMVGATAGQARRARYQQQQQQPMMVPPQR